MVKTPRLLQGVQIRSLVRELRSCKPWGVQILLHHLVYEIKHCPNSWRPPYRCLSPSYNHPISTPEKRTTILTLGIYYRVLLTGLPCWLKQLRICLQCGRRGSIPGWGRSPGEGNVSSIGNSSTPVFLPGEFHGQWRLVGSSPWGSQRVRLGEEYFHTSLVL